MSESFELLALGGGPAALAAVSAYREAGGRGEVAIVSDEGRMPYSRPPLSKEFLRGELAADELPLQDEFWLWREGVALVSGRAMLLDTGGRELVLAGGRRLGYRRLVFATGAEPVRPGIPGADDPSVRVIRSLDDVRELRARLDPDAPVIVVGAGFIGCEVAASLQMIGHPVSLICDEEGPNRRRLGPEASDTIKGWLEGQGVQIVLGQSVERIERRDGELHVIAGAERRHASVVVMATGVSPRSELAPAGITAGDRAISVDASMRTGVLGLLAAGDVAFAHNAAAGRALRVEHWGDALAQGEVAGRTAAGRSAVWDEVPGFWSTIGSHTLKYAAWGDGYDAIAVQPGSGGEGFAVWYGREGTLAGVLTHDDDSAYERGRELIAQGAPWTG